MNKKLLITDVDNTLFDWQEVWYQTFSAMVGQVLSISGVDEERLYAECSAIHQRYGTSEYSQILGELPCLQELYGDNIYDHMAPAIDAFRAARRDALRLYPGVLETLGTLNCEGVAGLFSSPNRSAAHGAREARRERRRIDPGGSYPSG